MTRHVQKHEQDAKAAGVETGSKPLPWEEKRNDGGTWRVACTKQRTGTEDTPIRQKKTILDRGWKGRALLASANREKREARRGALFIATSKEEGGTVRGK